MAYLYHGTWFTEQGLLEAPLEHQTLLFMPFLGHSLLFSWQLVGNWKER